MKAVKVLLLSLLVVLVAVPMAGAQAGTWGSSFSILNLGGGTATVSVAFYDAAGVSPVVTCLAWDGTNCTLTNPFDLAMAGKQEINMGVVPPASSGGVDNGRYSVVISANQPIAAIATLIGDDSTKFYNGTYSGVDEGEMDMYLPAVMQGFYNWNSHFSIQNLTDAGNAVSITFYAENSQTICDTIDAPAPLAGFASWYLDLSAETLDASCNAVDPGWTGYNGSVKISGAGAIAVVDNQTAVTPDGMHFEQTYNSFSAGATKLYLPDLSHKTWPIPPSTGWDSSINVQNIGANDTTILVTLNTTPVWTNTYDLGPNASVLINLPYETPAVPESNWANFSGVIESDGEPIVAVVNAANIIQQASTYNAPDASQGATTLAIPISWQEYYGWDTSFVVQNIGAADVTVHVKYSASDNPLAPFAGAEYDFGPIAVDNSHLFNQGNGDADMCTALGGTWDNGAQTCSDPSLVLPAGYSGGAIVTVVGSGTIIATVNTTNGPGQLSGFPGPGDWSTSYNAIGQ